MWKAEDLTGKNFGRLTVIKRVENTKDGKPQWLCECSCENHTMVVVRSVSLKSESTKSCGCLRREVSKSMPHKIKHGQYKSKLYAVWKSMKDRVNNQNNAQYKDYGGRGIAICEEWYYYENFMNWAMNNGYKEGLSIERKDVNGNYCPENCCWITMSEQSNNRRNTRWIEFNGKKQSIKKWSLETGLPYDVLKYRFNNSWDVEKALTAPVRKRNK